jgi:hypothetical protein
MSDIWLLNKTPLNNGISLCFTRILNLLRPAGQRARIMAKQGKRKICYDKLLNLYYFALNQEPSGYVEKKTITIGIDPGSLYDGFSIIMK